jgi:PTH1 family peptidyl-tRNA hydrolase
MKIIIGLGNPGAEYVNTRHNAGIMLVDRIYDSRFRIHEYGFRKHKNIFIYESKDLVLVKTAGVFMNESGKMIYELKQNGFFNTPPESPSNLGGELKGGYGNLYLAHDDLDIKLGEYKIQFGVGPKVHYGVQSVEQALGTKEFWRIRIGIDNRFTIQDSRFMSGEDYVLQRFMTDERTVLEGVLEKIIHEIT